MQSKRNPVIVIGAGASGMMAAIAAARAGAPVLILEQMKQPGRKLLLTGNGKCNLTNLSAGLEDSYHSVGSRYKAECLAKHIFSAFSAKDTLAFFEDLGVLTQSRDGYVYPRSGQAQSVLNALLAELKRLKVRMKYDTAVTAIVPGRDAGSNGWTVKTESWAYQASTVVLACGSRAGIACAYPEHPLAGELGHTSVRFWPALTALHCADPDLKLCEGARTRAKVTLRSISSGSINSAGHWGILPCSHAGKDSAQAGMIIASEEGELQWTASELSGIPVFQLSRYAYGLSEKKPVALAVDFLPDYEEGILCKQLHTLFARYPESGNTERILNGFVHERIAAYLIRKLQHFPEDRILPGALAGNPAGNPAAKAACLAALLKRLALVADRPRDFRQAQICCGGISLDEVNGQTLESVLHPGLFFAGEMLDLDGPCGGYNLQWAWSSGAAAGKAAAGFALQG